MSAIAIVGKSGTGKSTSIGEVPELKIKGLDPKQTVIINVAGKDLPFRGWKKLYGGKISEGGNLVESSSSQDICKVIKYISDSREDIKDIIIDDGQYILAFEFMARAKETGYNKFTDMGANLAKLITTCKETRSDLNVYFMWHPEEDKETGYKMKTIGHMIDSYLTLEGLFTVILYSDVSKNEESKVSYSFITNHDGKYPARSPIGMFPNINIPNDLGLVSEYIHKYNNA